MRPAPLVLPRDHVPFACCAFVLKWSAEYANLLLQAPSALKYHNRLPQPQQYGHILHIQQLINELERLTRLDDGLRDARPFILTLSAGVEHSMTHG